MSEKLSGKFTMLVAGALIALSAGAYAQTASAPTYEADGTVHVPAFDLPPSVFWSPEALAVQQSKARQPSMAPLPATVDVATRRQAMEAALAPLVEDIFRAYPVKVEEQAISHVPVRVVTPKNGGFQSDRVLINVHGGGFSMCAYGCAMLESAPISVLGRYKVITVNYRQGPEAKHPAALEDITAVYRELLKAYDPKHIGLYGCSAGGSLTAQMAAWLPRHGLPQPAAIGIFGAGGARFWAGDSAYTAGIIDPSLPPPERNGKPPLLAMSQGYFDNADLDDAILSPALHPDVIAKFPPTLLITGTRSMDMSPALVTNSALLKAGVSSTLIVGEGMGHCYIYRTIPEARDAHQVTVNFFRKHLN